MRVFIILSFLCPNFAFAKDLSLSNILEHQFKATEQGKWLQDKIQTEWSQNSVMRPLWLTEGSTSLEKKMDIRETIVGSPDNVTTSLPWVTRLNQNTPYGLSLNLEYYKELDSPEFRNAFQDERYRGSLELSLFRDLLGKESRKIIKSQENSKQIVDMKVKADLCLDISKKYIAATTFQEKLALTSESLNESEKILKKLSSAVRKGALNKSAQDSMSIDVNNLRSEFIILRNNLQNSFVDLEQVSGVSVLTNKLRNVLEPRYVLKESKTGYLAEKVLKQESELLKAQMANLKMNNNQDVSLYGGYESTKFTQNTINVDGKTDFAFVGVQAQLRFGDGSYKNEKDRLEASLRMKNYESSRSRYLDAQKEAVYLESLKSLRDSYQTLKSSLHRSSKLEQRSYRNFYNGKTKYFEFLSTRNQVFRFKHSVIDTKANFWRTHLDYLHLKGRVVELCSNGGGL